MKMAFNPATLLILKRFRSIKRGYYSLLILIALTLASLVAELWVNDRALLVHYQGEWYFPVFTRTLLGHQFGLQDEAALEPVSYRDLQRHFAAQSGDHQAWLPIIPYNPNENNEYQGFFKASPPDISKRHLLGTDTSGRDVFARLVYGYRTAILFALVFTCLTFLLGGIIGTLMGYLGGLFDLIFQRLIEIWSNIPFLYMVIIIFSIIPAASSIPVRILILLLVMVLFSWTGLTYYMRTETYREKSRDYTLAAIVIGAGTMRILIHHILPNTMATLVTFIPFTMVAAITSITALDFLGWGLPPPTPSLGELLKQGTNALTTAPWIATSAFTALVTLLVLVTYVGEAVREAFDPRQRTRYQ